MGPPDEPWLCGGGFLSPEPFRFSSERFGNLRPRVWAGQLLCPNEPAFLQAEVVANGTVLSATGKDFLLREWNEKIQKIIRYSFQRGFAEGYDFTRDPAEWEEPEIVEGRILLPRMVSYPTYREYRAATRERGRFEYTPRPIEDDP